MKSQPPDSSLPRAWCDFNARGWTGTTDDDCYYAFDKKVVSALHPQDGIKLFAYEDEGNGEVIGCEVRLEKFEDSWRLRPDENTWFRGKLDQSLPT